MAPHSSTLAWKIPWMEEPGRLQSMGSWRVGHDWATSLSLFTFMHWRRKWQPTPVFLPGESQGRGSLGGCRLWGRTELDTTEVTQQQHLEGGFSSGSVVKNLPPMQETQETWDESLGREEPLEEEMATHFSSTLAWEIPWTEEPGRLQSMGLPRVRHDWVTAHTHTHTHTHAHAHTHTHNTWKEVIMVGTVFLCFYFSVLMTVAVIGCIESWLNPHNVYSSFLRVFILQDSLMGLAFMVMHVCAYHLSIFYLQGSLGAYICILPPRDTPSLKMQP